MEFASECESLLRHRSGDRAALAADRLHYLDFSQEPSRKALRQACLRSSLPVVF